MGKPQGIKLGWRREEQDNSNATTTNLEMCCKASHTEFSYPPTFALQHGASFHYPVTTFAELGAPFRTSFRVRVPPMKFSLWGTSKRYNATCLSKLLLLPGTYWLMWLPDRLHSTTQCDPLNLQLPFKKKKQKTASHLALEARSPAFSLSLRKLPSRFKPEQTFRATSSKWAGNSDVFGNRLDFLLSHFSFPTQAMDNWSRKTSSCKKACTEK